MADQTQVRLTVVALKVASKSSPSNFTDLDTGKSDGEFRRWTCRENGEW